MRKSITLIALICSAFCFSQNAYLMASTESGGSLLPPPNDSNANTELITGNAASFPPGEVNGLSGITPVGPVELEVTSEVVDDGYEGDYVVRIFTNGYNGGYGRAEHQGVTVTASTTYEYVLLYRHSGTGTSGRFRVFDGTTNIVDTDGLGTTTFTEVTGTFTTGAGITSVDFEIWASRPFLGSDGTEWIEYKLTVKEQD